MSRDPIDLESLTLEACSSRIGDTFLANRAGGSAIGVELVEAAALMTRPPGAESRSGFSLLFLGPNDPVFEQGILVLEHEELGGVELFVVPVRSDESGVYYEAIINRLDEH